MSTDQSQLKMATLASGCFWCTEAVFKRLKGVTRVVPGYTGGIKGNPDYEDIVSETTGHAEAIQVTYDPHSISYEQLLEVFWATHNPTSLNKQDYDTGPQYRSAIFYHDEQQKKIAQDSKEKASKKYSDPIVTKIEALTTFYPAEAYHKDYYDSNRSNPYCMLIIDPKIRKLMENFKEEVKDEYKD